MSRICNDLVRTVLHIINVTSQTVTTDGTVTQGHIVRVLSNLVVRAVDNSNQIKQPLQQIKGDLFGSFHLLGCFALGIILIGRTDAVLQSIQVYTSQRRTTGNLQHIDDDVQIIHLTDILGTHDHGIQVGIAFLQE